MLEDLIGNQKTVVLYLTETEVGALLDECFEFGFDNRCRVNFSYDENRLKIRATDRESDQVIFTLLVNTVYAEN